MIVFAFRCGNCSCVIIMGCRWVSAARGGEEGGGWWDLLAISSICQGQGVFCSCAVLDRREGERMREGRAEGTREGGWREEKNVRIFRCVSMRLG